MNLAKAALLASANDLPGALAWLAEQAVTTGAAKAEKLAGREAKQGLVGVVITRNGSAGPGGVRGAMVELSCETDFVARTDEFRTLLEGITRSLAFFAEEGGVQPLEWTAIKDVPLLPPLEASSSQTYDPQNDHSRIDTIDTALSAMVSRLGENISLRRALSIALEPLAGSINFAAMHSHGSKAGLAPSESFQSGLLAGLVVFQMPPETLVAEGLELVTRALARQVVAVPTLTVGLSADAPIVVEGELSTALYEQPILTLASNAGFEFEAGSNVQTILRRWSAARQVAGEGLEAIHVKRWEVGGSME